MNDDGVVDLGRLLGEQHPTLGAVLRGGELHRAISLGATSKPTIALEEIRYLPTVPDPEKIICIGINYGNRNDEYKDGAEAPQVSERVHAHAGQPRRPSRADRRIRRNPSQLDYEGEIVLVIGKAGRRIASADAWQHVAGLSLMNEGSVRDWLRHSKFNVTPGKNFERSGSLGPWLVTADELAAGAELHLTTRVNGELRQDDTTANLIFPFARLIEYLSSFMRLDAGRSDRDRHADGRRRALRSAEVPARRRHRRGSRARARHAAQRRRRRAAGDC